MHKQQELPEPGFLCFILQTFYEGAQLLQAFQELRVKDPFRGSFWGAPVRAPVPITDASSCRLLVNGYNISKNRLRDKL